MNPVIDVGVIVEALAHDEGAKFTKDAQHIGAFVAAVAKKSVELASQGDAEALQAFALESGKLIGMWMNRIHKLSIGDLLKCDPFKEIRERTRKFAKEEKLDPALIKALG